MQFFPESLRVKIILNVFTTSLLAILLIGGLVFSQISVVTETLARENLLEQARRISSYIEYDWKGDFDLDLPRRRRDYYAQGDASQYAVMDTAGKVFFQSTNFMHERIGDTLKKTGKYYFSFETDDGRRFAALKYDYLFEGKIYPIYVIENEAEFTKFITTLEDDFLENILIFGIPLLLMQALVILIIFRQAFKPIIKAAHDARQIKYDNLSYRVEEKGVPHEVLPLIQSVNNGLSRLEKSAEAQKFFIANAAHELRTPLSILKARIASLKDEKEVYLLNSDLRNINRLIGQMLDISRLDLAENIPKAEVNLNVIAKQACEDLGALFINEGKELSLEQKKTDQVILGNDDILLRAILNLLENALKHTPDKTKVEVVVDEKRIVVRDYGKPIADEYKARIFEKFEKLPESTGIKGSGLGLAIVKKAAELHNGEIDLIVHDDGNEFVLKFP